jgi:PAS domain S-box-containing protein
METRKEPTDRSESLEPAKKSVKTRERTGEKTSDQPPAKTLTKKHEKTSDHVSVNVSEADEVFKLLVEAVDEYAIFALSPTGVILTWNQGGQRLKGYKAHEVIGTNFARFYTQPDIDRNHPAHELELAAQNGKYEEEGWRIKKDGSQFWANVVITALRDSNGVLKGYGKVTRDLTQRRNSEIAIRESEERFRLLVTNVTDYAIITLDIDGHVTSWNTGAERIKGYREQEIIGKHFSAFYPRSDIENGKPEMELRIATNEGRYEEEGWRIRKDGTMFWANVSITAMRTEQGVLKGFAQVTRDLTARKQAEEALRQSQERYRLLVDNINDYAIMFLDSQGRITSWNAGAAKITGYAAKDILGAHVSKFYTPEDIESKKIEKELRTATETGRYEEEGQRVRKDGTIYWANVVITVIKDGFGKVVGFSKVTRDITESRKAERRLRESEERFRLMVESVQDYAIFMLDPEGRVATWNRGAERNKGYTGTEIIGQHFSVFYPKADVASGKPAFELREAIKNGRFEDEGWRVRKDGSLFWANVIISPFYDNNNTLLGFSKVTRNLTERKKAEDALREAYADLEKRIERRTKDLSIAKAKAEAAVKIRENFFSMASHELKTPLSSLKMQAQIRKRNVLRGNLNDFKPENLLELCNDDERQIDRLSFLVDNMLDISKLTSGALTLVREDFYLNDVVTDVVTHLTPLLEQSGNTCSMTADEKVKGVWDRHRLEQVFTNLLSNAGKYAPGKPVEIHISQTGGIAKVAIKDYGRGISEQDQSRIFKAYERVSDNGQTSGLGLGLFITKQIVEAHQGDMIVESKPGVGTTFVVELPLNSKVQES